MNKLIVFSVLCGVFYSIRGELSPEFKEKFAAKMEAIGEKCAEETGASQDDIAKILTKDIPETREGKCMLFCGHRELHIQTPDGGTDLDSAIASLDFLKNEDSELHDKMVQVYTICSKVPFVEDPCDYAVALSTCGTHEAQKLGMDATLLE